MNVRKTKFVYVIELDPKVTKELPFIERNPQYRKGKQCFYVGMTGRDPKIRFTQHKTGYKANKYAQQYGIRLAWECFAELNPMTYEESLERERLLAGELRAQGHAVWQN